MLKLVTGKPGDGKTSNELWEFLHAPEYKGRPKFCTPIKGFEPEKHGVIPIDHINVWQSLPEGSVVFCDEVQKYLGAFASREPPKWVQDLATHRHDGFDFILTTQDPGFIHAFPRKLCKPHVHYMRPWNMKGVRYSWDEVQSSPASKTSKKIGTSDFVTPNPEVFKIYTSTVLDTHKARPPWKVLLTGLVALVFMVGGIGTAVYMLSSMNEPVEAKIQDPGVLGTFKAAVDPAATGQTLAPVTAVKSWSVESMKPAIEGMAYTAPIYASLTAPSDFPRVSACIYSKRTGCECYSQQATRLQVPEAACLVHVKEGSFDPWLSSRRNNSSVATSEKPVDESGAGDAPKYEARPGVALIHIESGKPGHLW